MTTRTTAARRGKPRRTVEASAPAGFREMLETCRLKLLALFRSLDRLDLVQDLPPELRVLFELDADFAEALWALDQPIRRLDVGAMTRDTITSLRAIPEALHAFFALLSESEQRQLARTVNAVRASLAVSDAYLQIPGRDPAAD